MGATGGLAIDRDDIKIAFAQTVDPGDEALGEQRVIEGRSSGRSVRRG